jgi:hypothetical protein
MRKMIFFILALDVDPFVQASVRRKLPPQPTPDTAYAQMGNSARMFSA